MRKRRPALLYLYCPSLGITRILIRCNKRKQILKVPVQETRLENIENKADLPLSIPETSIAPQKNDHDNTMVDTKITEAAQEDPTEKENIKKETVAQPTEMQSEAQEEEFGSEDGISTSSSPETNTTHEPSKWDEGRKKPKQKMRKRKKKQSSMKELRETKVPPSHSIDQIMGTLLMKMIQLLKPGAVVAWIGIFCFLLIGVTPSSGLQENFLQETQTTTINPQVTQSSPGNCRQYLFCVSEGKLWNQPLSIKVGTEREYCKFQMTIPNSTANCTQNSTVRLTNDTCLLLDTIDLERTILFLEYGEGRHGKSVYGTNFTGSCRKMLEDVGADENDNKNKTDDSSTTHTLLIAILTPVGAVTLIGVLYFGYKKCIKRNQSQGSSKRVERSEYKRNGHVPTENIEMGGQGEERGKEKKEEKLGSFTNANLK
ncbi:uncharacterized protein LOC108696893 isoform X2 [Xenopus laevis]|uniref:Uncharacterized protein LOC108696893 isoform X2 n=1 Tax=Xenopus laevis TaxID=8355 RepID=A0A8J0TDK6_XENLA|nr:uncharacterized protein LOC108696893 isoform X2 [Xenopus laevis]